MNLPAHGNLSWTLSGDAPRATTGATLVRRLAVALAITLLQVAAVLGVACATAERTPGEAFRALCRWDGAIYLHIAEHGYRTTIPPRANDLDHSNVAFFPGYPLAARWLRDLTGRTISMPVAMVLTAQVAAVGFWAYWLALLARYRFPRRLAVVATAAIALHPGAFFLVVAYSESLFLLGMLGFLFWITAGDARLWPAAALHGVVMTATRLGGLPVAFAPLLAQLCLWAVPAGSSTSGAMARWRAARPVLARLGAAGGIASLGGLAFFAFCQWRFGAWDVYLQAQRIGWNLSPDWAWFARPINYTFLASTWHPNVPWPDDVSRFCVVATIVAFAALACWEVRLARQGDSNFRVRLVLYLAALALFALHAAGVSSIAMKSMLRYSFGVHALLLLAVAQAYAPRHPGGSFSRRWAIGLATGLVALAALQAALVWRFLDYQWVA